MKKIPLTSPTNLIALGPTKQNNLIADNKYGLNSLSNDVTTAVQSDVTTATQHATANPPSTLEYLY